MPSMIQQFGPFHAPKRYVFIDPDTKYEYKADSRESLLAHIITYREQNELPQIAALGHVVDNYLCSLPENRGACEEVPLKRGFFKYLKGGIALFDNLFFGRGNMVDQETADRRAAICITCKYNVFPDREGFIKWSDEMAEASTGGKKSKYHDMLGNCGACSCPLRPKVWYKGKLSLKPQELAKMQEVPKCWQLIEFKKQKV